MASAPKYPGIPVFTNGNHLVSYYTEARLADAGVFYPITPSTEMGELFQLSFAEGNLNVFGHPTLAIETEGEHSAQGGATAYAVTGKRVVNFTSGQGLAYASEQYYHAPGKLSTMVLQVAARALTKHALNVHCGHDDIYAVLDTGWIMLIAEDAQQAADQSLILRKVTELALTPGMNIQDGFLTSHMDRSFLRPEAGLIREFLGASDDIIDCPTPAQVELFGPTRRRVPEVIDLRNPALIGPVQNQEHYINGVVGRRTHFCEPILGFLETAYDEFAALTGRQYGLVSRYQCDDEPETVFVSLGSAHENIKAAVDHLRKSRGVKVGAVHVNVLRPFPEKAVVEALRGSRQVIVLERTDEPLSVDNPLAREIRAAFGKAQEHSVHGGVPLLTREQTPRIFRGTYGVGSRDFRPEGILGAFEYATGAIARADGKRAEDGETYFALGVNHPYEVISSETPSLLPEKAIAVRLQSIGGWGMITTGKNLAATIGALGEDLEGTLHISANPKYGSEKKGAPTNYFLVVAPERIHVNCDLKHVDVVLCCDPKAFTHSNPIDGIAPKGALVWESDESPEKAWTRIPRALRQQIIDNEIRLFTLPGFAIAREATKRPDLQLRMQGNAFLGAFFRVSPFLTDNNITKERFHDIVLKQYKKKFGRFGDAVVEANMLVMEQGFERLHPVSYGDVDAMDASKMRGKAVLPVLNTMEGRSVWGSIPAPKGQPKRPNLASVAHFDSEFRGGFGYRQPASPLAAVGTMAAATGHTASKYVARRETPIFIAENCTQCMKCIASCPDTALVNTAQDVKTVLTTAITHYVESTDARQTLLTFVDDIETQVRENLRVEVKAKSKKPFKAIVGDVLDTYRDVAPKAREELLHILDISPFAYSGVNAIFAIPEKKNPGQGGVFSIAVTDLCKGCGECVTECGEHDALRMVQDSEELNARVESATKFFGLLPETPNQHLGLYTRKAPTEAKPATLRNHMMVSSCYKALVSGDGACAGCGEKSVLHAVASLTEAMMRPLYHARAERLLDKAARLRQDGLTRLADLRELRPKEAALFHQCIAHVILGLGGENDADTKARMATAPELTDQGIVHALVTVMTQDAFNHRELQAVDGLLANGMSVMAIGASTGCNTVYSSTPPANPHPYPWMNSLFQDGATITWMFGESFIRDHANRSILPERLCDALLGTGSVITEEDYFDYTHFTDSLMTDEEVRELPKAWCIGGDGALGDIGFQNISKVILQNRPNVKLLMLDTQVYSNTGGQNSDSSVLAGGFDMNQLGAATQGKLTEKKSVSEAFTSGHGSPFVAQVSMADAPRMYKAILDGLTYRGTAFFQCFTTCQPEHGVGDDMSTVQATRIRDSRGMPEFVFDPSAGETYPEIFNLKGNRRVDRDWIETKSKDGTKYIYTVAHWAATEARFRRHLQKVSDEETQDMINLEDILVCITQDDVVHRRFLHKSHRAYVPDFGVYTHIEDAKGALVPMALSRQMVLFCVERRKSWRLLQSRAGTTNKDYVAQRTLLKRVDTGEISVDDLRKNGRTLMEEDVFR